MPDTAPARVGLRSKVSILERAQELRRAALLASVVRHLEVSALDDAHPQPVRLVNALHRLRSEPFFISCKQRCATRRPGCARRGRHRGCRAVTRRSDRRRGRRL
ncbi:hypothetical protein [Streptomyces sp. NPDC029704]|uniref:hypothetical protein n=1 Tax=Streptomyces sp. NPDC029704 TaxID=3156920 RepID=UPI0033FCA63C